MCGIVGYLGHREAAPVLVTGLRRVEYRGYDSVGVVLLAEKGHRVEKAVKPDKGNGIDELEKRLEAKPFSARAGIGHTRWATHGAVSQANTHPHACCHGRIFVVHNGMVTNYVTLKEELEASKHAIVSETDTELLAHLIEEEYEAEGDHEPALDEAVRRALARVKGSYGLAIMCSDQPDIIVLAKHGSPIMVGIGDNEVFAASDERAFASYTQRVVDLEEDDIVTISVGGVRGTKRQERRSTLECSTEGKGVHPTFMLKEILEQPRSISQAFNNGGRLLLEQGDAKLGGLDEIRLPVLRRLNDVVLLGCGTALHACKIGAMMMSELGGIAYSRAEVASEVRSLHVEPDRTAVIAVSQSGETADTIAAVSEAVRKGALPIGVINREASTLSRLCGRGLFCNAGDEVAVASTKAFTSQLVALSLIALMLGRQRNISLSDGQSFAAAIKQLPKQAEAVLSQLDSLMKIGASLKDMAYVMFMGRGAHAWVAKEGALKMEEITYRPAGGYEAGELKHGRIALLHEKTATVALVPRDDTFSDMVANLNQAHRTGTKCVVITTPDGAEELKKLAWKLVVIPKAGHPLLQPVLSVLPLQLFAYSLSMELGLEPDRPRNLAKAVTVK